MFDSLKEYQTTKASKLRETNYQMDTCRNIKLLSPITNGNSDKKIIKRNRLFIHHYRVHKKIFIGIIKI